MSDTPPILIVRSGSVSKSDITLARKAGVLVVVVKDPSDVRYMDPPLLPTTRLQSVAVMLIREVMAGKCYASLSQGEIRKRLAEAFMNDERPARIEPPEGSTP